MNSALITTLAALFVFGLLITSHELGHFIIAKLTGVEVIEFAIGMGPKLLSFKKGETLYTLRLLPIGGYNKMLGEQEASNDPRAFSNKSPWKRLGIIVAGALMNFLIAVILFLLYSYNIGIIKPVVGNVQKNFPAANAGVMVNDKIISVNGVAVKDWGYFTTFISENKDKPINMIVKRDSTNVTINLIPVYDKTNKRYRIGIEGKNIRGDFAESAKNGVIMTGDSIKEMYQFLGRALHGKVSSTEVGGPVAIVKITGQVAQTGIWRLLYLTGFLSVNLGFINLIPFPALDGGWVVILLFEGITGRKIDPNKIGFVNFIGFAVLMIFVVLVTFKDIFGKSIF